jgi:hypothetical protein
VQTQQLSVHVRRRHQPDFGRTPAGGQVSAATALWSSATHVSVVSRDLGVPHSPSALRFVKQAVQQGFHLDRPTAACCRFLAGDAARRWALAQGLPAAATPEQAQQVRGRRVGDAQHTLL